MATKSTVPVRLAEEEKEQLDALARETGRSRSHHLTQAVRRYLAEESWQVRKIRQGVAEADEEVFEDDAAIEAEMRGLIAEARAAQAIDAPVGLP